MERVMGMTARDGGNTGNAGAIASANNIFSPRSDCLTKQFNIYLILHKPKQTWSG